MIHGNIPALVEIWLQGGCKKALRLPQYLADDEGQPHLSYQVSGDQKTQWDAQGMSSTSRHSFPSAE